MLSNKWTFSLTCFVVLLAFGLACVVPSAFANKAVKETHHDLDVTIGAAESMVDVSAKDGLQIASGRDRMRRTLDISGDGVSELVFQNAGATTSSAADDQYTLGDLNADNPTTGISLSNPTQDNPPDAGTGTAALYAHPSVVDFITLSVEFTAPVNLFRPGAALEDVEEAIGGSDTAAGPATGDSGGNFGPDDIFAAAFDLEGRQLGVLPLSDAVASIKADFIDASSPGQRFLVRIHQSHLINAYGGGFEISKLVFFIPRAIAGHPGATGDASVTRGIRKADFSHVIAHFGPDAHQHVNTKSNQFAIDLVDADQGDPQYAKPTGLSSAMDVATDGTDDGDEADGVTDPGSGTPGVVSIMRTASRTGFIETGDFEVRIILTEEPLGGLTADKILVDNGTVKSVGAGVKYKGGQRSVSAVSAPTDTVVVAGRDKRNSQLGSEMIDYYIPALNAGLSAPAPGVFTTAPTANAGAAKLAGTPITATNGTVAHFPEATGRDNMYYSYIAMISPNPKHDGTVTVSVGDFDDNVLPVPNRYVALTAAQRDATRLTGWAKIVRDARVMNETLTVRVSTAEDTKIAAAKTAYDARQKGATVAGNFDGNPNLKALDKRLVIPANGYLVLTRAKSDATIILNSDPKIKKKLTAAQKLYNVKWEFELPEPAKNLYTYFRNGGTLQLVYADIPEATGSGHDNSVHKKDGKIVDKDHDDYTGYDGASSGAIAAGDVIINEVMWGTYGSQYIELHNTTDTAIGIDNLEWAIMVGSGTPPAPFTAIDTVGNNPSTGWWEVSGVLGHQAIRNDAGVITGYTDAISMSRIPDSTDGTAAASWASSVRRMTKADGTSVGVANLTGTTIGTPGAENAYDTSAQDAAKAKAAADAKTAADKAKAAKAPAATASDLRITEIMVASGEGRLPQWIEITNTSVGAVSLNGWVVGIDNDSTDADVVASSLSIKLDGVTLDAGQSALVVSKTGRNSGVSARAPKDNNAGDLDSARIVDAHSQIKPASKVYSMLSETAFRISLEPPLPLAGGVSDRGDVVGNLGGGWELEMSEGNRSSLIRREMGKTAEIMGTDAAGWVLASETSLIGAYVSTYYGDKDDVGTPGYNAGGALPVELSKFGAKRDPLTGQVVITWETQSELNNAGFYIKRAEHKTAKFVPVNPTLIPGAGTTSEKQTYTYTDTTAKPNIVYYYQIEDVSLDGNRQTLTRAHRLKGHVGAAGKLSTLWGELKERE